MEADCQWKNLVWRLSPSRGLGRKINEQDRSSIKSEDKSRCSDRYFGVFIITVEIAQSNGNAYCKIHTTMRLGRILGPVSSFLMRHFLLCAICAWRTAFPIPGFSISSRRHLPAAETVCLLHCKCLIRYRR